MDTYLRISMVLCIVLIAAQGVSLMGIVSRGNHDFVSNIIGSTLFWLAYTVFEYIYKLRINYYLRLAVVIAIVSDGFCGFYLNLYGTSSLFDRIQHIFSAYALALFFYAILMQFMNKPDEIRPWIKFVLVAAIGMAAGSLNEIIEFLADTALKPQILNQPSLEDTDLDLISNTIGSVLAGIHSLHCYLGNERNRSY
jgi:hypothetical protein